MEAIAVFFGGGFGACLRYLVSLFGKKYLGITYWATFLINILGCLFLGFVATIVINHPNLMHHDLYLFLTTGIAGGFTTFSTFSLENIMLIKEGKTLTSIIYMFLSLLFGIVGIYFGYALANII